MDFFSFYGIFSFILPRDTANNNLSHLADQSVLYSHPFGLWGKKGSANFPYLDEAICDNLVSHGSCLAFFQWVSEAISSSRYLTEEIKVSFGVLLWLSSPDCTTESSQHHIPNAWNERYWECATRITLCFNLILTYFIIIHSMVNGGS